MSQGDPNSMAGEGAAAATSQQSAVVRDGDFLVVPQRWIDLPRGCLECGEEECIRLRVTFRKASKLCAIFGLLGAFYYFTRPTARLRAGFCRVHRIGELAMQSLVRALVWGPLVWILLSVGLRDMDSVMWGVAALLPLWHLAIIFAICRNRLLKVIHADRYYVWLAGVPDSIRNQFHDIAPQRGSVTARDTATSSTEARA